MCFSTILPPRLDRNIKAQLMSCSFRRSFTVPDIIRCSKQQDIWQSRNVDRLVDLKHTKKIYTNTFMMFYDWLLLIWIIHDYWRQVPEILCQITRGIDKVSPVAKTVAGCVRRKKYAVWKGAGAVRWCLKLMTQLPIKLITSVFVEIESYHKISYTFSDFSSIPGLETGEFVWTAAVTLSRENQTKNVSTNDGSTEWIRCPLIQRRPPRRTFPICRCRRCRVTLQPLGQKSEGKAEILSCPGFWVAENCWKPWKKKNWESLISLLYNCRF